MQIFLLSRIHRVLGDVVCFHWRTPPTRSNASCSSAMPPGNSNSKTDSYPSTPFSSLCIQNIQQVFKKGFKMFSKTVLRHVSQRSFSTAAAARMKVTNRQVMDYNNLGFDYVQTRSHVE